MLRPCLLPGPSALYMLYIYVRLEVIVSACAFKLVRGASIHALI